MRIVSGAGGAPGSARPLCITLVEAPREMEVKGKKLMRKKKPEVVIYPCIRCGLCEEYCPQEPKAIRLTCEFSGSGTDREVVEGEVQRLPRFRALSARG